MSDIDIIWIRGIVRVKGVLVWLQGNIGYKYCLFNPSSMALMITAFLNPFWIIQGKNGCGHRQTWPTYSSSLLLPTYVCQSLIELCNSSSTTVFCSVVPNWGSLFSAKRSIFMLTGNLRTIRYLLAAWLLLLLLCQFSQYSCVSLFSCHFTNPCVFGWWQKLKLLKYLRRATTAARGKMWMGTN